MKKIIATLGAVAVSATAAHAGGIDRSGQNIGILFEKGRMIELSFGRVMPSLSGTDVATRPTGNVAIDYSQIGLAYKYDINDSTSFALIIDQPFGAKVAYGPTSPVLGGTKADASSAAITGLLRYKFNPNFSVYGGLRAQQAKATVDLRGIGYGPVAPPTLNGYSVGFASDWGLGYVAGVAYEKPEIALRIALTYNSAITHDFKTTQNFVPGGSPDTRSKTPQSVNLDFQTGVAANTLVFGQIRWVDWSGFKLKPSALRGNSLVNLENSTTYTLGVGRKFSDAWSGAFSVTYEKTGNKLVSPLAPSTGKLGATLAGIYTSGNMKITTGINYTKLGDASPYTGAQVAANTRANFTKNKAVGVGIKVGYSF